MKRLSYKYDSQKIKKERDSNFTKLRGFLMPEKEKGSTLTIDRVNEITSTQEFATTLATVINDHMRWVKSANNYRFVFLY